MSTLETKRLILLAFSYSQAFNSVSYPKIFSYFPSLEFAYQASKKEWNNTGLANKNIEQWLNFRRSFSPVAAMDKLSRQGIQVVTINEKGYPPLLAQIYQAPFLLYYSGTLNSAQKNTLAIVGSRKHSYYGYRTTRKIISELDENWTIVSGLALGIDSIAHQAALEKKIPTGAVLGAPINHKNFCPQPNQRLAQQITRNGGFLLSEFPPNAQINKFNFPLRNRLIAGLSLGTLLIEAGEKSGALITARFANEEGRDVMAVPGSILNDYSVGSNHQIALGASLITKGEDVRQILKSI